jgi:hypothetical protein
MTTVTTRLRSPLHETRLLALDLATASRSFRTAPNPSNSKSNQYTKNPSQTYHHR